MKPWPRLWHNLRASRQTELADQFPAHVVCQWLGNSEDVAREHYLSMTSEHVQRAISGTTPQRVMPHGDDSGSMEPQSDIRPAGEDSPNSSQYKKKRPHAKTCDRSKVVEGGFEPPTCGLSIREPFDGTPCNNKGLRSRPIFSCTSSCNPDRR